MNYTDYIKNSIVFMSIVGDMVYGLSKAVAFNLEDGNPYKAILNKQCERLIKALKNLGIRTDHLERIEADEPAGLKESANPPGN